MKNPLLQERSFYKRRIGRGGSWKRRAAYLRVSYHYGFYARERYYDSLGFRLFRTQEK